MTDYNELKPSVSGALPKAPIARLTKPFVRFLHVQAAAGVVLFMTTLIALGIANSAWAGSYAAFWNAPMHLGVGGAELRYPLWYWVNDGLMVLFFFVIGLEIKRELVHGELRDRRKIILPAAGALGGAMVPVLLFLVLASPAHREGWAIPMATDIAFVVGCMALFGRRVPTGLKVFVLSLAILDDILAVIIIAAFFTGTLKLAWLGLSVGAIGLIFLLNRLGVRQVPIYFGFGLLVWLGALKGGVHPTVAGAILGLMTPASAWLAPGGLDKVLTRSAMSLDSASENDRRHITMTLSHAARESISPLARLEHGLHPWVGFVIIPIFALANAGVAFSGSSSDGGMALAIAVALVVGKPLGILAMCGLFLLLGWSKRPAGTSWPALAGAACLCGIGFTMSLFLASLSLGATVLAEAKMGVLVGSAISMAIGMVALWLALPRPSDSRD